MEEGIPFLTYLLKDGCWCGKISWTFLGGHIICLSPKRQQKNLWQSSYNLEKKTWTCSTNWTEPHDVWSFTGHAMQRWPARQTNVPGPHGGVKLTRLSPPRHSRNHRRSCVATVPGVPNWTSRNVWSLWVQENGYNIPDFFPKSNEEPLKSKTASNARCCKTLAVSIALPVWENWAMLVEQSTVQW